MGNLRSTFDSDGYVAIKSFLDKNEVDEMRPHTSTGALEFSQGISDWSTDDDAACVQMTAGAGDILVHHSLTIHRANGNSSDRDRKSIGFIFYRDDVAIDQEAHDQYQHDLHESLREQSKI